MKYLRPNYQLKKFLGKGTNSSVWNGKLNYFTKKNKHVYKNAIIKRIPFKNSRIFFKYNWKNAGFLYAKKKIYKILDTFVISKKAVSDINDFYEDELLLDHEAFIECQFLVENKYFVCEQTPYFRQLYRGNEFRNESEIGFCLNNYVNKCLPIPIFCRNYKTWADLHYGNIAMENAGKSLDKIINKLSLVHIQSIVLQCLFAICWAQHICEFKHHDLHLGNIFLREKKCTLLKNEWILPSGNTMKFPKGYEDNPLQIVIADFGLSSCTNPLSKKRYCRADYDLLEIGNESEWGIWCHDLNGHECYDALVLLCGMKDELNFSSVQRLWINKILGSFKRFLCPTLKFSKHGRPLGTTKLEPLKLRKDEAFDKNIDVFIPGLENAIRIIERSI